MGNVGYRFLISFFGLTFTIILIVNLLLYGQVGFFGDINGNANSYFGFSSFIESLQLFETIYGGNEVTSIFSASNFVNVISEFVNNVALGIPKSFEQFLSADYLNPIPSSVPAFPTAEMNDILDFFVYFQEVFKWFGDFIQSLWVVIGWGVTLFRILLSPIYVVVYGLYLTAFLIYYVVGLCIWAFALFQGVFNKPLPSSSYSQWDSMIDYWNSQWSSLPQGLALPL